MYFRSIVMELESYELVVLRRPADRPQFDDETTERIQPEPWTSTTRFGEAVVLSPTVRCSISQMSPFAARRSTERVRFKKHASSRAGSVGQSGGIGDRCHDRWCAAGSMVRPGRPVALH